MKHGFKNISRMNSPADLKFLQWRRRFKLFYCHEKQVLIMSSNNSVCYHVQFTQNRINSKL